LNGTAFNALSSLKLLTNTTLQNALDGGNGGDLKWRNPFPSFPINMLYYIPKSLNGKIKLHSSVDVGTLLSYINLCFDSLLIYFFSISYYSSFLYIVTTIGIKAKFCDG
jgi:hypothetical protein